MDLPFPVGEGPDKRFAVDQADPFLQFPPGRAALGPGTFPGDVLSRSAVRDEEIDPAVFRPEGHRDVPGSAPDPGQGEGQGQSNQMKTGGFQLG